MRSCVTSVLVVCLFALFAAIGTAAAVPAMPMPIEVSDTIKYRWLNKPVLESRLLDDMEKPDNWSHHGFGKMTFTAERAKDGKGSLRLTSPTKGDKPGPVSGRPFGAAIAKRNFPGEDWSKYNRLSFWVYPTLPGFRVISMCLALHNDGREKVPGPYGRNGRNFVLLEGDKWNHVVWEIAHLGREKVTAVEFGYRLQGNEPGATETVCYDIDHLELQKVEADHFEGWDVARGRIAYCHTGYPIGAQKSAIACGLAARQFSVVDAKTGRTILTRPIGNKTYHLGQFQVIDFTQVDAPGIYVLRAGGIETRPFEISRRVWRDTVLKTINLFYCERCGTNVTGIHDVCHRDWMCKHEDRQIHINGGWHDAGDLSQGLVNTSEATYAMLALAQRLQEKDPALAGRLLAEAQWGLDWMLKTRFGDGFRCTWATMDFWTDGVAGTVDDVTSRARSQPFENFLAASTEALASWMLKGVNAARAADCLRAAEEDWRFAMEKSRRLSLELAAAGLQSSVDLYQATRQQKYAAEAFKFADVVLSCQQQSAPSWDIPLTGFFYNSPEKNRIQHYSHRGHEQAPIVGLVRLCELFPDHEDWIKWYAATVLYSQYYKKIAEYTAPYCMLPASIYRIDESKRPTSREQVQNGIKLSDEYYLRLFPVWYDFRGNHGTVLSQTKGLAAAAMLRKDRELTELCSKQLQWVLGRNPFCQSTMYGEGHDYAPQYTAMSGDMVGSLPVGIQTHFDRDVPYWPADNCYNYKEVWVHPSSRWLWLMCELYEPALQQDDGFSVSQEAKRDGSVYITAKTKGRQDTQFEIRVWNLETPQQQSPTNAPSQPRQTITWHAKVIDRGKPWIAVVVPGTDMAGRQELFGTSAYP
ncbi:MAG: glycoside hydrolase family 9 protein [Phycisphaerales bacterium]|nr:MAG: glycoside hydrolase family 9 protein [Phycisphaerales bacterium]